MTISNSIIRYYKKKTYQPEILYYLVKALFSLIKILQERKLKSNYLAN